MSIEPEIAAEPAGNLAKAPAPAITYTLPAVTVGNLGAVEGFVSSVEAFFADVRIDPTDKDQVKALKGLRADINKAANAIDGKRRDMDRAIKAATAEADGALGALRDRLRAVYAKTGRQIDEADRIWRDRRWGLLAGEYEGIAPDLAPLIGLGAFAAAEKRLVQKSTPDAKACALLDDMVARAVSERETLKGLGLAHAVEADEVYCETLSLKAAIDEDERLTEAERAKAEHAERMRGLEESVAARRGGPAGMAARRCAKEPVEEWRLRLVGTRQELERALGALKTYDIDCEVA